MGGGIEYAWLHFEFRLATWARVRVRVTLRVRISEIGGLVDEAE